MALPVLEGLQAIIQREQPQIILSIPDRQWRSKAVIELGRRARVPSLTIQAALISNHQRYDTVVADRVAAMGDVSCRLWEEQGISAERIVVTGSPRFDDKYVPDPAASSRIHTALRIPPGKGIIAFATQPLSPRVIEENVKHIARAARRFPDHQLVFKVHPREETCRYEKLLASLGEQDAIIVQDIDLDALLQASALVITGFSTVALEAMILGRPVLIVNLTGEPDPVDYVQSGAALGAYRPEDITKQMRRLLDDAWVDATMAESRRKYVVDQLHVPDGQATGRVVALIEEMVAAGASSTAESTIDMDGS
jgi:CDP-glycerol glycerophosphotransferase (TagB/SpsB family)